MRYSIHVICGCRGPDGKQLGSKCPKLSSRRHGSAGWAARIPTSAGTRQVKRFGFDTKKDARDAAEHASKLLGLAPDDATRARIGDMITAAKTLPAIEDVRRRLGLGLDPGQPGITVAGWMESWLAGKRRARRASTARSYEMHNRLYISPQIGDLPLARVSPGHVEQVLAAVPGSAGTRHRVLATLRAALNAAVKARQITWNPCVGVELEPDKPAEARRWSAEEAARFIDATAADPMGLMFRVMVLTGMRRGELCGLRWADADLNMGMFNVKRTLLQLGGKLTEGTPKTRAGERLVFTDAETTGLLREHRKAQLAARLRAGEAWQDDDLVFCQPGGRPWNPDYVSKRFRRLAAQAGVPVIKLHEGGRHTGNSLMRDAEVSQEVRMRLVGHSDRDVNDRYTHPMIEAYRTAAEQTAAHVRQARGGS